MAGHRKNPAAAALGRRRWKDVPKEERADKMGALAGKRWAALTPEERSAQMARRRRQGIGRKAKVNPPTVREMWKPWPPTAWAGVGSKVAVVNPDAVRLGRAYVKKQPRVLEIVGEYLAAEVRAATMIPDPEDRERLCAALNAATQRTIREAGDVEVW